MSTPESSTVPVPRRSPAGPAAVAVPVHRLASRTAKVRESHLARKAIVSIRQSSPQQVAEHKESTARQDALADLASALGWPRDRVEIVDADQGRSGQTAVGRLGFQYILAELGRDHVGIVLGLEASRLARSDPDWTPLVRLCGVFRALLCDYDGLYDPTDFKDRLLPRSELTSFTRHKFDFYSLPCSPCLPRPRPPPRVRATYPTALSSNSSPFAVRNPSAFSVAAIAS
jgi:resolvase-like protein